MRSLAVHFTFLTVFLFSSVLTQAQQNGSTPCTAQVIHSSGSQVINGIDVTVTRINFADTSTTYCPSVTTPYIIGYRTSLGSGTGQYSFQFTPAASSVTLNLSAIEKTASFSDEIEIIIDGSHYAIPAAASSNGCDSMAVLTSNGNITGHASGQKSGWKNLIVPGPIHALAVANNVTGISGGALFSLFVCNTDLDVTEHTTRALVSVYPNPMQDQLHISTGSNARAVFSLYNVVSARVLQQPITQAASIDVASLPLGLYYYQLQLSNGQVQTGKLQKQ